jgi:hypothetical protein
MRTKATLFLFVLVAALGTVAYYFNREWDAKRVADSARTHVLGADAVDLSSLRIEFRDGRPAIELQRRTSGWELVEPVRWPANYFAVARLLSELQTLERESSFPVEGAQLADYGLDAPQCRLAYGRQDRRSVISIGKETDVGGRLYILPEGGDRILVVGRALLDSLAQPVEHFRSDTVFTLPTFEVRSWNMQIAESGNLRIWLTRSGDKWIMETPVQARADTAAVESLLERILGNLKVERFESGLTDLNLIRLATPDFIVAFEGAGRREALLVGSRVPGQPQDGRLHFAKLEDNPTIFVIAADFLDDLRRAQLGLRDRRLLEFAPNRVQSISIQPGGRAQSIELQRLDNGPWQVLTRTPEGTGTPMPGDAERIGALVTELHELRALPPDEGGFATDAPSTDDLANVYYLASPAWTLTLADVPDPASSQVRTQTILLGGMDRDRVHVQVGTDRVIGRSVYRIDRGLYDDLRSEPRHYRSRQLQRLPEGARLTGVALRRLVSENPDLVVQLAAPDQPWEEATASLPDDVRPHVLALVGRLRELRAADILATEFSTSISDDSGERPWTWLLESTINLEGGAGQKRSFRLYLDDYRGGPTLVAATPDLGLVYLATQPFIDAFGPLVLRRADPGPPEQPPPPGEAPPAEPTSPAPDTTPPAG